MPRFLTYSALVFICGLASHVIAAEPTPVMQWDRSSAMAAVRSVNINVVVDEIGDVSSLSDSVSTLAKLSNLQSRGDWPLPAREAAIYQFARSLAPLPRDVVAIEVMRYLRSFEPQVLVADEDHSQALVPMFNVRGAAAGVENGWLRSEAAMSANVLIKTRPTDLVSSYVAASSHNQRSGYLDALQQADYVDVEMVQSVALQQLEDTTDLSAVVAVTAVITTDNSAIRRLIVDGRGAGLSSAFKALDQQLSISATAELLAFAVDQAPASNAALAIAAWWPRLSHDASSRDLMLGLLADPSLGANAALALARNPDLQTIKALQDTAEGESASARRAQMALDLNRAQLTGGLRP